VSTPVANLTERQLWIGVVKLSASIALLLILGTFLLSLMLPRNNGLSYVPVEALLFAVAFSILVGGVGSFLSIIDWFADRRAKREEQNG
jgi:hypothetical protein